MISDRTQVFDLLAMDHVAIDPGLGNGIMSCQVWDSRGTSGVLMTPEEAREIANAMLALADEAQPKYDAWLQSVEEDIFF